MSGAISWKHGDAIATMPRGFPIDSFKTMYPYRRRVSCVDSTFKSRPDKPNSFHSSKVRSLMSPSTSESVHRHFSGGKGSSSHRKLAVNFLSPKGSRTGSPSSVTSRSLCINALTFMIRRLNKDYAGTTALSEFSGRSMSPSFHRKTVPRRESARFPLLTCLAT